MATLDAVALDACVVTHAIKLIILGSSGVGKSVYTTMCRNPATRFEEMAHAMATVGLDFSVRHVAHPLKAGEAIRVTTWDTAGQERFDAISRAYFRDAHGVIIMYDVTNLKSYTDLAERWVPLLVNARDDENADEPSLETILIGNKTDLLEEPSNKERAVSYADVNAYATEQLRVPYVECSCKTSSYEDRIAPIQWLLSLILRNPRLNRETLLPPPDQTKHRKLHSDTGSLPIRDAQGNTKGNNNNNNGSGCCS
jgi:small GTP-binding protein